MILRMTLEHPLYGYWDGGAKDTFDFSLDSLPRHDARGAYVKIGYWQANAWFHVALGRTVKSTLANARRRLSARAKRAGEHCRFAYIDETPNAYERQTFGVAHD